jgi:hypothetical protein
MIDNPLRLCHGNNLSEQQNKIKVMMMSNNMKVECENMITKNSPIMAKNKKIDNGSSRTLSIDSYSTMSINSACAMSSSSNAFANTVDDDDDDDDDDDNNNNNNNKCQQRNQQKQKQKQQANQKPTIKHKRLLQMFQRGWKKKQSTNLLKEEDFNLLLQQLEFTGDGNDDDEEEDRQQQDQEQQQQEQEQQQEENSNLPLIPADPDNICFSANTDADTDTASFISTINDTDTNTDTDTDTNTNTNTNTNICTSSSNTKTIRKKQQQEQKQKHVHFGSLIIYEHPLVMGGAGLPSCGPSVSLSWIQETCIELPSVISYEESRPCLPRKGIEMLHSKNQRIDLLLGSGHTFREIKECDKECDIIRKQRIQTVKKVQQRSSIIRIGNKLRRKIFKLKRNQ